MAGSIAWTQEPPPEPESIEDVVAIAPSAVARHALIVIGIPGDQEHSVLFRNTAGQLRTWLVEHAGCKEDAVTLLVGREETEDSRPSTKKSIEEVTAALVASLQQKDGLWVFLIGHGSRDKRHGYLHLPGPDLNSAQWAGLFSELKAGEQVFWLTHSGSGAFLKPMSLPGRIVVTATDPEEVNETRFPHLLAEVMSETTDEVSLESGDATETDGSKTDSNEGSPPPEEGGIAVASTEKNSSDENGEVAKDANAKPETDSSRSEIPQTVLELFRLTALRVGEEFEREQIVLTEHAQIDDNGDGKGTEIVDLEETAMAGDPTSIDGVRAGATPLSLTSDSKDRQTSDRETTPPPGPNS